VFIRQLQVDLKIRMYSRTPKYPVSSSLYSQTGIQPQNFKNQPITSSVPHRTVDDVFRVACEILDTIFNHPPVSVRVERFHHCSHLCSDCVGDLTVFQMHTPGNKLLSKIHHVKQLQKPLVLLSAYPVKLSRLPLSYIC
jgi:hypothetical protein